MLEVIDLSFGYIKQPICLKDIDINLKKGETALILGGEESGKTSLLRVIAGLEKQYFGRILIDGKDASEISLENRNISYLPEEPVFFDGKSLLKNIQFLFKVQNKECPSCEEILEVFNKFDFDIDIETKIRKLKSYQKKIFSIIRSYFKNPKIVLIDDMFFGESEENIQAIKNAIYTLKMLKNDTIMVIFSKKECYFTNLQPNIYYLSFARLNKIKTVEDLKSNPVELSSMNYFGHKEQKMFITRNQNNYFIVQFEKEKISRTKFFSKEIFRIKLSSNFYESLNKEEFVDGQLYEIIVCAYIDLNLLALSDDEINKKIIDNELFLFNQNGSRIRL